MKLPLSGPKVILIRRSVLIVFINFDPKENSLFTTLGTLGHLNSP
jgi:hypothetical protein